MAKGLPTRLTAREGRKFAWTVGVALLVVGAIAWWRERPLAAEILAILGVTLSLAGIVAPTALGPLQRAWMGLAHAISKITTPVFMGIVYFVVIAPVGVVRRRFGATPLVRPASADGPSGSYWIDRADGSRRGDLNRQY